MRSLRRPSQLCKNLVTLFAIAVVFQLTRLLTDELDAETKTQQSSSLTASGSHKEYVRVMPGASSDKSGKYSIHRFYKAEGFGSHMKAKDITLVSHVTIDKMHLLMEMSERWDGPMSVSLFAPGLDASFADDAIDGLRLCWPVLREFMTFHLVYPTDTPANMTNTGTFAYLSCKDITRRLMTQKSVMQTDEELAYNIQYPHNLLRNIAREGALTEFDLVVDAGMTPSDNLRPLFIEFARINGLFSKVGDEKETQNIAYVLPTYEVRSEVRLPYTKKELQGLVNDKNARILMQETCWFCQKATDYDRWIAESAQTDFGVSYPVPFTKTWMPFFISRRKTTPKFDENFYYYGYDRLMQICEMKISSFSFQVLSQGFLVSRGYKVKASLSAEEKRVRDDWKEFKANFAKALEKHGHTDEAYQQC